MEAALPDLAVPTRILWGERDLYFSLDTPRRAQALIPDANLHVHDVADEPTSRDATHHQTPDLPGPANARR